MSDDRAINLPEGMTYASDSAGLKEAAQALQPSGTNLPATEIRVLNEDILPYQQDDAGNERGVSLRKAATELRKYREQRDAQLKAFDTYAQPDPETQALQTQGAIDQTIAALQSMTAEDLRLVIQSHPDEQMRVAASHVLSQRQAGYQKELINFWDGMANLGVTSMFDQQRGQAYQLALAQAMALAGLQAKWGFNSLADLEQLKTENPGRHAAIIGDAAQIDLALAQAWRTFHHQVAQEQQLAQQAAAVAFNDQAMQHDAAFLAACPDLANNPQAHEQAQQDALAYCQSVLGIPIEQLAQLWNGNILFRSAPAQLMLLHASRYAKAMVRSAQQQQQQPQMKNLPPVQRPGSRESAPTYDQFGVAEAAQALEENPKSIKAAARLLGAKRRAAAR